MTKRLLVLVALLCGYATAQYIPVVASSCIRDASGSLIASGTFTVQATDDQNRPLAFRIDTTTGQATTSAVVWTIGSPLTTPGTLAAATTLQLADPTQTQPLNIKYHFSIKNLVTNTITNYSLVTISINDGAGHFDFCRMNPYLIGSTLSNAITGPTGPASTTTSGGSSGDFSILGSMTAKRSETERFFDGGLVGFSSLLSSYTDGFSGGTSVVIAAGALSDSSITVLSSAKPLHLHGSGMDATNVTYNSAGAYIAQNPTDVTDGVTLNNSSFSTTATATGFLGIGSTSTAFSNGNFRRGWSIRNVTTYGPGASIVGSIGASLTQLIGGVFDNWTIRNYERPLVWDRSANSVWIHPRFWSYKFGPLWSSKAGSGSAQSGSDLSVFIAPEYLGPTVGSDYTVTYDTQDLLSLNALYETQVGSTPLGYVHITANAARFTDFGGFFSLAGGATKPNNLMVWDTNYVNPKFIGTRLVDVATTFAIVGISAGTPNAAFAGNRAECIGCSAALWNEFYSLGTAKAIAYGQDADNGYSVSADHFRYFGAGGNLIFVADSTNGFQIGNGFNAFKAKIDTSLLTVDRTWQVPDAAAQKFVGDSATQTLINKTFTSPVSTNPTINSGIANSGTGFKHVRSSTACATGASIGATCTTSAISWPGSAFPDTAYDITCTLASSVTNVPTIVFVSKSAGSFTVTIAALTAASASYGEIDCSAIHD